MQIAPQHRRSATLWCGLVLFVLYLILPLRSATAQPCYGDPEGSIGTVWRQNNLKYWDGGVQKPIMLADPTLLKLQDGADPPKRGSSSPAPIQASRSAEAESR